MKIVEIKATDVKVGDVIHSWGKVIRIELDLPSHNALHNRHNIPGRTFYNDSSEDWYSILDIGTVDVDVDVDVDVEST